LNISRVGKRGIEEGGHIRERRRGKKEERRRLSYIIQIDFLV
jgi:hypothetical protein